MAKADHIQDTASLRRDNAALVGLLGRLASTCGIPHHTEGLRDRVEHYCNQHRDRQREIRGKADSTALRETSPSA